MRPQFTRSDWYAPHPPRGSGKASASFVIKEPPRTTGWYHKHVLRPKPPFMLYGTFDGMLETLEQGAAKETDKLGRRQRSTSPVLIGAISTYPYEWDEIDIEDALDWIRLDGHFYWLQFGERLRVGLLHHDESFLHGHHLAHDDGRNVKRIHPGHIAAEAAYEKALEDGLGAGRANSARRAAYAAAMEAFLDDYQRLVGGPCGLARRAATPCERKKYSETAEARRARQLLMTPEREERAAANKAALASALRDHLLLWREAGWPKTPAHEIGTALLPTRSLRPR